MLVRNVVKDWSLNPKEKAVRHKDVQYMGSATVMGKQ